MSLFDVIESRDNARLKLARALRDSRKIREQERAFVAEGLSLVGDLLQAGMQLRHLFFTREHSAWVMRQNIQVASLISMQLMATVSDEITPPGVLGLFVLPIAAVKPTSISLALALDGIADPGNLGACMRVAAAAGCNLVLLAPGCTDAWNPKTLRGGMGAHARLPVLEADWPQIAQLARDSDASLVGTDGATPTSYLDFDFCAPTILVIGSESHGLSSNARRYVSDMVSVPLANQVESLNAAVACGVIMFEVKRQRAN